MSANSIDTFLRTVASQIRWKRAQAPLLGELKAHICDCRDNLINKGKEPHDAEKLAVAEMGNPEDIGLALDRIHRPRPNWMLIGCTAALLISGLILLWAVGNRDAYFRPMLIYSIIGIGALLGGYFLDYTILAKCPTGAFWGLCGVCAIFPLISNSFRTTSTQLCYALPFFFAVLIYRSRDKHKLTPIVLGYILCIWVAAFNNWLSMTVYVVVSCLSIVIFAHRMGWLGAKGRRMILFVILLPTAIFAALCTTSFSSITRRMEAIMNPSSDPFGMGWVPLCVREAIGSSRFIGAGQSSQMLDGFIFPNELCSVDYLLAAASHKFGLIAFFAVAALIAGSIAIIVLGIKRQSCRLGKLIMLTVGVCFTIRTLGYFADNLGFTLLSFEGIPLFSFCGKLMILDMFIMGLLLSVFRMESIARDSSPKAARL